MNEKCTFVYNVIDNRGKKRYNKSKFMYVINILVCIKYSKKISRRIYVIFYSVEYDNRMCTDL